MTVACTTGARSPYETGRLAQADSRLFRPGGLDLTARAIALADLGARARILDLGCGAGDTVQWLCAQGFDAIGIDPSPNPANSNPGDGDRSRRIVAHAEALPFPDASFDVVLAECSFSLVQDRERALAECARVLADRGFLILSDLVARQPEAIAAVRSLSGSCVDGLLVQKELEASLTRAGFSVQVWEDHSRALRECAARFLFEHGSLDGLWDCGGDSSEAVQTAMRAARVGYFLMIATRRRRNAQERKIQP